MGQQQILLLILVSIIVGIATIVAMNVLSDGSIQANRDAVRQDLSAAASYVQSIYERPTIMGGASGNFTNMDESQILQFLNVPASSFQPGDSEANNENGRYYAEITEPFELIIYGEPKSGPPNIQITVGRNPDSGQWTFDFSDVPDE